MVADIDAALQAEVLAGATSGERSLNYLNAMPGTPVVDLLTVEIEFEGERQQFLIRLGLMGSVARAFLQQFLQLLADKREEFELPLIDAGRDESNRTALFADGFFAAALPPEMLGTPFTPTDHGPPGHRHKPLPEEPLPPKRLFTGSM